MKFSNRVLSFEPEIFAALNDKKTEMESKGRKIYNLSIGTPDFTPPEYIRNALIESAKDPGDWVYALRDIPELTDAVISYYKKRFGVELTADMICSCNGSQEGMGHIGMVLANAGDTVLLPTPCYPAFISGAKMAEAEPWYYPLTEENGFLPDVKSIPEDIAEKAKYMIFNLPSNPTGSVAGENTYQEIIEFAKKHDIVLIHDNAYSDIIFDGYEGGSFLQYEGAKDTGIEFFSLSKSFNVTGARISFCIGRPDVIAAFKRLRSQFDFGMFIPVQKAAVAALNGSLDRVQNQCRQYEERRNALCSGLRSIGWNVPDNHGSMFVWAPIPPKYKKSMDFCMDLIEKAGVVGTPGISFGPLGEGYIRMALVLPPEKISEVIEAIKNSGILD